MMNKQISPSETHKIHEVVKLIALDERETSINFTNFNVENDMDCNARDSHFEHHHNTQNEYMK